MSASGSGARQPVWKKTLLAVTCLAVVVVQTRDRGHAGESGFAYSEVPLSPKPFGSGWSFLEVPGRLILVRPDMRIDAHWWEVLNNLD